MTKKPVLLNSKILKKTLSKKYSYLKTKIYKPYFIPNKECISLSKMLYIKWPM